MRGINLLIGVMLMQFVTNAGAEPLTRVKARWPQIEADSIFFKIAPLTPELKQAIVSYLDCVGWRCYPPDPSGSYDSSPFLPTIGFGGVGWSADGKRLAATFILDEDLRPLGPLLGQETPEFAAMIKALRLFRRKHPFRHTEIYREAEKERERLSRQKQ